MTAHTQADTAREAELIERVLRGEREVFYDLVQPYERNVYLTALAALGNPADAEEAAQDAVLKAFRNLGAFRGEARFSTWLLKIALNEARMRQRRLRRVSFESLDEERQEEEQEGLPRREMLADWREIPLEVVERNEVREELARALQRLPEKYRQVFMLRDVEQLSMNETAAALNISRGLVKTRLFRARLQMRRILKDRLGSIRPGRRSFLKGVKPW